MFVIPSVAALLAFVFIRPHEWVDWLHPVTLNAVLVFVAFGYLLDLRVGASRLRNSPLVVILVILFVFCGLSLVVKAPEALIPLMTFLSVSLISFLLVSQGIQTLRALNAVAMLLLAITLLLIVVGVKQGSTPSVCYLRGGAGHPTASDGRPCSARRECEEEGGVPGGEYLCEHPGPLNTRSIGGRVRFLGFLEDPNELAMAISMGAPLAIPFFERRRTLLRMAIVAATFVGGAVCIVMTKSRSGQLSLMALLGVYFVRRFGRKGILLAAVLAIPILLLGGRSGEEAESSSMERLECWAAALAVWRENPIFGVGFLQFTEYWFLTSHNSFMLALVELGPLGLIVWTGALYVSVKIVVRVQIDFAARPEAAEVRSWAIAFTASLAAMIVSAFFLSVIYKPTIWVYFGMIGAFYTTVRAKDPSWRIRLGLRDLAFITTIDVALVTAIAIYIKLKGV